MRLPLLVGARPKVATRGPVVNLTNGTWRMIIENLLDSVLRFHYHSPISSFEQLVSTSKNIVYFEGPCKLQVEILSPGSERDIHVYAESLNAA